MTLFTAPSQHKLQNFGDNSHELSSLVASRLGWCVVGAVALTYFAFQKHLLPDPMARVVSKLFFYPTFPITALLRLGNYWTKVDDTLLMGCAPMDLLDHPAILKNMGVTAVVNMCYEYPGPKASYARLGIQQLHLPTLDHSEVSLADMKQAVAFIQGCKKRGEKVLVHCKAGNGRAASVALCWMVHEQRDKSAKELNELLLKKRRVRGSMYKQRNVISFEESLAK